MDKSYYFAVDLGATSGRTILSEYDGHKIHTTELTRFENPIINIRGHLYWNIAHLYYELLKGLEAAGRLGIELESIGIDTWGCDVAYFDKDGMLLGLPYCYRDSHTNGAQNEFFKKMSKKEIYGKTGIQFMDFNTLFQLHTISRSGSPSLKMANKILFIPDALIYMLTGKDVCEYTIASTSQILNPKLKNLDSDILTELGIDRNRFGTMVMPGSIIGKISEDIQRITGIGSVDVVAVAGHDTASAVVAVPAENEDYAYLSCGTWSLLGIETKEAIINEDTYRQNFTNEGGVEGTTRFLKNICGLWLFEQCRKEFKDVPGDTAGLVALCKDSRCESLIDPDARCFANPQSMTTAIREYCTTTGQVAPKTPADFCRCIFRSLSLRYRQVLEMIQDLTAKQIKRLHVIGGGSQNSYLMQYTANAINMPVICGPVEGTALGNVLMQMKAAGKVSSLSEMRRISASSVELKTYTPSEQDQWETEYIRFNEIQNIYKTKTDE